MYGCLQNDHRYYCITHINYTDINCRLKLNETNFHEDLIINYYVYSNKFAVNVIQMT